jgi:hypothetical protein
MGGGPSELTAGNEPFNGDGKCLSRANESAYRIPVDDGGINMLTNKKNKWFTISELEVWEVKYIE